MERGPHNIEPFVDNLDRRSTAVIVLHFQQLPKRSVGKGWVRATTERGTTITTFKETPTVTLLVRQYIFPLCTTRAFCWVLFEANGCIASRTTAKQGRRKRQSSSCIDSSKQAYLHPRRLYLRCRVRRLAHPHDAHDVLLLQLSEVQVQVVGLWSVHDNKPEFLPLHQRRVSRHHHSSHSAWGRVGRRGPATKTTKRVINATMGLGCCCATIHKRLGSG